MLPVSLCSVSAHRRWGRLWASVPLNHAQEPQKPLTRGLSASAQLEMPPRAEVRALPQSLGEKMPPSLGSSADLTQV